MDMNEAVSKQSGNASQGANIIKKQTSGRGGGGGEGQWGCSRVRSSLHLSPLSSFLVKGGKREFFLFLSFEYFLNLCSHPSFMDEHITVVSTFSLGFLCVCWTSIIDSALSVIPSAACQVISWLSGEVASPAAG